MRKKSYIMIIVSSIFWLTSVALSQPGNIFAVQNSQIAEAGYSFLKPLSGDEKDLDFFAFEVLNRLQLKETRKNIHDALSSKSKDVPNDQKIEWMQALYKDAIFTRLKQVKYDYEKIKSAYEVYTGLPIEIDLTKLKDTAPLFSEKYSRLFCQYVEALNAEESELSKLLHLPSASNILYLLQDRMTLSQQYFKSRIRERYYSNDLNLKDKQKLLMQLFEIEEKRLARYALKYFNHLGEKDQLNAEQQNWLVEMKRGMTQ